MSSRRKRAEFVHHFEGKTPLQGLLEIAGSELPVETVVERMKEAHARGQAPASVFPGLFEGEPRFPDPELARALYQNLFGLWELLAEGKSWDEEQRPRPPREKKPKAMPPAPFAPGEPDEAFTEAAWRYLEDLEERDYNRLADSFENRQDALLGFLDDSGLSDDGYGHARHLLFELHATIELGWPKGLRSVSLAELEGGSRSASSIPAALQAYSDETLFEAEQDEASPLSPEESAKVREVVKRGLAALWSARKA